MKLGSAGREFASVVVLIGALTAARPLRSADLSLPVGGNLLGTVVDAEGAPQLGASVQVYNKYQRFLARAFTTPEGHFAFVGLPPDTYSVRVVATSFLPASRDHIAVKPGLESVLNIHLATLLSNIELSYRLPTGAMSEEWKLVLRSSPATRPVNRILDDEDTQPEVRPRVFSGTHAMFAVSGGDGGLIDEDDSTTDLGTAFAFSTNLLEKNQLQIAGAFGQHAASGPAAIALCAIYSRIDQGSFAATPEMTFTMAQFGGVGSQLSGDSPGEANITGTGIPALRAMSLSVYETADPLENVRVEYGATAEAVELISHTSRLSPFGRITVDLASAGQVIAAYSDGGRPDELRAHQSVGDSGDADLIGDLSSPVDSLARSPQVSNRNGELQLQRTQSYELGYRKVSQSRTYAFSAFSERVSNGRLNVSGDLGGLNPGDLFSDNVSGLSTYNIGDYNRIGYLASMNQRVNDLVSFDIAYGRLGGFAPGSNARFFIEESHNIASLSVKARVPGAGTRFSANYGWVDSQAIVPHHTFTTQDVNATPGFNVLIRQPLPSLFGISGRFELTADLRNLLAQGYLPMIADGRQLLAVEAPRAIRGGLKFVF